MDDIRMYVAMQYGLEIDHYGGIYHWGKSYDHCKKVEVTAAYKLGNKANVHLKNIAKWTGILYTRLRKNSKHMGGCSSRMKFTYDES